MTIQKLAIKHHSSTYPPIETQYEYTYKNRKYHGINFAISSDNDSFYVFTGAVSEVKSRDPAFGFVNPAQPSQCVLVKGIDPEVNKAIPFLMTTILIVFGGVLGGEKGIKNPRYMFPFMCSFIMAFLNISFLQFIVNPTKTFYITLGVIALAFWIGRYWSRLSTR